MTVLALLLLVDAGLHAFVVQRYGLGDRNNVPFLVFAIVDLALVVAVFAGWPYAVWATLILSVVGIVGLTVTFSKPRRDKTIDRIIWTLDALIVVVAAYLLFVAGGAA